jgi:sterol 3beta-glucosyltransferase
LGEVPPTTINYQLTNMKIAILALGSRGDVEPYIALGKGLKQAGYFVRLISHENYEQLVTSQGLDFYPFYGNIQELMETPKMRELIERGNFLEISAYTSKESKKAAVAWARSGLIACAGMDLLVAGVGGGTVALALSEKLDIPVLRAYVFPFTPTKAFPAILLPQSWGKLGGLFNRLTHHLFRQMMWQGARAGDTLARRQVLDLPAAPLLGLEDSARSTRYPALYGFSPAVIPPPADWKNTHVTGYWYADSAPDWTPPPELVDFLNAGKPPIYVGFGSMGNRDPAATAELVLEAIARTGQRAIVMSGWGGLQAGELPNYVHFVKSVPHSWLFPRMAAVIHHGGAGTTAAGLRAGVPTIIVPFFGDQPFWGQRVADLGVGVAPIPRKQLTVDRLVAAIDTVTTDRAMRQRAADLGAKIQAEDGVGNVVAIVKQIERNLS